MSIFENSTTLLKSVNSSWHELFKTEFFKPYMSRILGFINHEKKSKVIFPPEKMVFSWTELTDLDKIKVVILGQDPYHGEGQAHGLAFSVLEPTKPPPSLVNIFKELSTDIEGFTKPTHGNLTNWAKQGVLLLNSVLTVTKATPNSHKGKGWEDLTDAVLKFINTKKKNIVFVLWGKDAQKKCAYLDRRKHLVIQCSHPSPLSANSGFFGSKCFSRTNRYLEEHDMKPIDWNDL